MGASGRTKNRGRTTSFIGAMVFLALLSIIIFCAAVASWAPFHLHGYATTQCVIRAVSTVECGENEEGNVWSVSFVAGNASEGARWFMAVDEPYTFGVDFNESAAQRARFPVNITAFVPCYGPSNPLLQTMNNLTCSSASTLVYPASRALFLDVSRASDAQQTWFALWIAFLVVFCISLPIVIIHGVRNRMSKRED